MIANAGDKLLERARQKPVEGLGVEWGTPPPCLAVAFNGLLCNPG
jgi:hypothetical protein